MASLREVPFNKLSPFIDKLADAGLTTEHVGAVLKDPSLAARMVAAITTAVTLVTVDYSKTHGEMISAAQFDQVQDIVTADYFSLFKKGAVDVILQYVHLGRIAVTAEVLAEMEKLGLRPATIEELIAFAVANPDEQRKHTIVALGTSWNSDADIRTRDHSGVRYAILDERGSKRCLNNSFHEERYKWSDSDWFLAAYKAS